MNKGGQPLSIEDVIFKVICPDGVASRIHTMNKGGQPLSIEGVIFKVICTGVASRIHTLLKV